MSFDERSTFSFLLVVLLGFDLKSSACVSLVCALWVEELVGLLLSACVVFLIKRILGVTNWYQIPVHAGSSCCYSSLLVFLVVHFLVGISIWFSWLYKGEDCSIGAGCF